MAGSTTVTGLRELQTAIHSLPAVVIEAMSRVAHDSAHRIAADAKTILRSKTHGTGATADAIHVIADVERRQYIVSSPGAPHPQLTSRHMKRSGRTFTVKVGQNNLPIWLEYGTRFMRARPYMRPAADAETDRYKAAMVAAADSVVRKALT